LTGSGVARKERSTPDLLRGARSLDHPADYGVTIAGVRIPIPKNPVRNLEKRAALLALAEADTEMRAEIRALCSQPCAASMLFWINLFADTYVLQEVDATGHERSITDGSNNAPFITYPYQDEILSELYDGIANGHDIAVHKTRKMGLSWLILTCFHWFWQFIPGSNFMEVSRKEDLVDNPGDPDSLFWKHDYLNRRQPSWLLPRIRRTDLKLVNLSLGSTIIGQSTTGDVGHGGRKTAVLFDEIARMRDAKLAWEGASQMTACRIGNSTPHGPGFFMDIVTSGKLKVLRAPFYDHPIFGRGRYIKAEEGKHKISSPWRDKAVAKAVSKREIAENIDMDFMGAGFVFFDLDQLDRHEAANCYEPEYVGDIRYVGDKDRQLNLRKAKEAIMFDADAPFTPWSLWVDLLPDQHTGIYRPPQDRTYIFGIDIAYGLQAANSTIIVKDFDTGEQVGEYASATVDPIEFAFQAMEAGYWWGGVRGCAFMCWENNGGAGQNFTNTVRTFHYPWLYTTRDRTKRSVKNTKTLGWASNDVRKQDVLGLFRGALARDEFVPRSKATIGEARKYIWYETTKGSSSVGPAYLEQESSAATATHGDRVIGAALAHYGGLYAFRSSPPERKPPPMSQAARIQAAQREKKSKRSAPPSRAPTVSKFMSRLRS
jgi:hypothetical protein